MLPAAVARRPLISACLKQWRHLLYLGDIVVQFFVELLGDVRGNLET